MSAGTEFNSIISLLLYWEFTEAFRYSCIILVSKCELNFLYCCKSELTLSYFAKKSLNYSSWLLSFVLISLTKLELMSVSSWMSSSVLIFSYWLRVKTILKFIDIYRSKNILKSNLKMAEARNDAYSTAFIRKFELKLLFCMELKQLIASKFQLFCLIWEKCYTKLFPFQEFLDSCWH